MPRFAINLARTVCLTLAHLAALALASPASALTAYAVGGNFGPTGGLSGLYTLDPATAIMTWVGGLHTAGSGDNSVYNGGIAYDPFSDRLYALGCDSSGASALFLVDRTDASMLRIGYCYPSTPGAFCSGGLAFDPVSRRLFAVGDPGLGAYTGLFELDVATGAATLIGGNGQQGTFLGGLGCDPRTGVLYANGFRAWTQESELFVVDKASGAGSPIGSHGLTFGRKMNYSGLAVDPRSGLMYGFGSFSGSQNHLFTVSQSTGAATSVAQASPNGIGVDGALVFVGTDLLLDASPAVAAPRMLRASPNPARASTMFRFALAEAGETSLAIHDLAGRRVVAFSDALRSAGAQQWSWDGTDAAGHRAAAGLYFATLRRGGAVLASTSVILTD